MSAWENIPLVLKVVVLACGKSVDIHILRHCVFHHWKQTACAHQENEATAEEMNDAALYPSAAAMMPIQRNSLSWLGRPHGPEWRRDA